MNGQESTKPSPEDFKAEMARMEAHKPMVRMVQVREEHFYIDLFDPTPEEIDAQLPLLRALDKEFNKLMDNAKVDKYKLVELGGGWPDGLGKLVAYFSEHKKLPEHALVPIDAIDRL